MNDSLSRRRFLAGAAGSALAMSSLAACSNNSGGNGGSGSSGSDVLTIGLPVTPQNFKPTLDLLSKFTKQTGVTIKPFTTNTTAGTWVSVFQLLSTRLAGGLPLDSAYIATEGMLLFEKQNLLEPLNSYISKDKSDIDKYYNDMNPQLLSNFRNLDNLNGNTYFLPIGYNVMSMWYNRALFKNAGLKEPAPGWTWDDFEAAATKLADPPHRYGFSIGTPTPGPFTDVYPWVLTNGGKILNDNQTQCVANNPQAIEAGAFVRDLVAKKLVNPPGGAYNAFVKAASDQLAMFGGGIWPNLSFGIPQEKINEKFAIVPWPKKVADGTPVGVGGYPMFHSSKNKDALWEFIKFSVSEEFQSGPVVPFGGDMPIRESIARSDTFLKKFPQGTENFSTELSYSTMIVGVPNGSAVETEISTEWQQILSGGISAADGMAKMQTNITNLMAQKVG
jgi:multiple sugar transport system substrate-binding protein